MSGLVDSITGAVVSELLKVVIEEAKMVLAFKSVSIELASKMNTVLLAFIEIETMQGAEELKDLKDIIDEARELVRKCSKVNRLNLPSKAKYTRKLEKILMRMCSGCELPDSVRNLDNLEVYCDEETGLLWERLKPEMRNLMIWKGM
ncbi:hypothetical protein F2Q68_00036388 [Brassica cretica]|uniref:RPW8 domain-containing protein n=1 Tax=Brassica cretica TaxID=69181 RepID=A0A8S9H0R8_BRACR|nr:hypothetical protein F2Q68_00036388 [Brassica cretica]